MDKFEKLIMWTGTKVKLHNRHTVNDQATVNIPIYSIYTCLLGENVGYEKGDNKARPVLVISNEEINKRSGNVIIVPLSKNIKWKDTEKTKLRYDSHYVLKKSKYTKLAFDSAIQCEDIRVVSKARLGSYVCNLSDPYDIKQIKKRIKYTFEI